MFIQAHSFVAATPQPPRSGNLPRAVRFALWLIAAAAIAAAVVCLTAAVGVPEGFVYVG
jgi:hypothetical protein